MGLADSKNIEHNSYKKIINSTKRMMILCWTKTFKGDLDLPYIMK